METSNVVDAEKLVIGIIPKNVNATMKRRLRRATEPIQKD